MKTSADDYIQELIYIVIHNHINNYRDFRYIDCLIGCLNTCFHFDMITLYSYSFLINFCEWLKHPYSFDDDGWYRSFYDIMLEDSKKNE